MTENEEYTEEEQKYIRKQEEHWGGIRIISLGQEFYPINPEDNVSCKVYSSLVGDVALTCHIRLEVGLSFPLNISIAIDKDFFERKEIITPLTPEKGYPMDFEDFSYSSRKRKLERLKAQLSEEVWGLDLSGYISYEDMVFNGTIEQITDETWRSLNECGKSIFDHLFVVITFPNGSSFSSRASWDPNSIQVHFAKFFPTDTGPLPKIGERHYKSEDARWIEYDFDEGFYILLPIDYTIEKLKGIKTRFLLLTDLD